MKLGAIQKAVLFLAFAAAFPLFVTAETWKGVPVTDTMCYSKIKDNPDKHEAKCILACAKTGFGVITADGLLLKLDDSGNAKVTDLLKNTTKKDHLRVTVDGERDGDNIKVKSISLN